MIIERHEIATVFFREFLVIGVNHDPELQVVQQSVQTLADIHITGYLDRYHVAEFAEHHHLRQYRRQRAVLGEQAAESRIEHSVHLRQIAVRVEDRFVQRFEVDNAVGGA